MPTQARSTASSRSDADAPGLSPAVVLDTACVCAAPICPLANLGQAGAPGERPHLMQGPSAPRRNWALPTAGLGALLLAAAVRRRV